jgi:uncharacterized protein (TIGR00297 family)/Raf kinase inhibitor-like YbhB/YbcL family protein
MNSVAIQLPLGIILAAIIAFAAYFAKSLTRSGAFAAFLLGTIIFGIGGLAWSILLLCFFISSSILSRLFKQRKKSAEEKFSKGSRRDPGQVAANGAVAGILTLLFPVLNNPVWVWAAFAGVLAAVNADTWATELGVLNRTSPRLITNGKVVEPGTSGAVSLSGTIAALAGAAFIAFPAVVFKPAAFSLSFSQNISLLMIVIISGVAGSLLDSLLGATLQAIYFCPVCQKETEKHPLHSCGNSTHIIRGRNWLNNDWVNTFCGITGALLAGFLAFSLIYIPPVSSPVKGDADMTKITISSPSFALGQPIPVQFSCNGKGISPELQWSGIPESAKSLALIMEDPDAPMGTFTHWVVYNLPARQKGLAENQPAGKLAEGGSQGLNSARKNGYLGPCPPSGKPHRYYFKFFATDLEPNLPEEFTVEKLYASLDGHVLASGEWMGTFSR